MMKRRSLIPGLALAGLLSALPTYSLAAPKTTSLTSAVSIPVPAGTLTNMGQSQSFAGGNFVGTLTVTGFQVINGVLDAVGTLSGDILNANGSTALSGITAPVTIPAAVNGSCPILNLTLGPLDLNLLGLTVHLNQVVLNITAIPGAGNLLGNLLCDVANLLNGGGAVSTLLNNIATLLNQIVAALP